MEGGKAETGSDPVTSQLLYEQIYKQPERPNAHTHTYQGHPESKDRLATSIQALVTARDKFLYTFLIDLRRQSIYHSLTAFFTSSSLLKRLPLKNSFNFGNKWTSFGTKSELHAGCWSVDLRE